MEKLLRKFRYMLLVFIILIILGIITKLSDAPLTGLVTRGEEKVFLAGFLGLLLFLGAIFVMTIYLYTKPPKY